jgi:hypothetical protein
MVGVSIFMRRLLASSVLAAGTLVAAACTAPDKGALILSVSTDMQAPKDVDVVSVYVETAGVVKYDFLGAVFPNGSVNLPSTLAIVEPDDPSSPVRIRVTAFKTQPDGTAKARVLRDVVTTIPHQRTGLLRMPLNFLDDGSVTGTLPASLVPSAQNGVPDGTGTMYGPTDPNSNDPGYLKPACDFITQGQTSIAGVCTDATVDSSKTPDYTDDQVFGTGGTPGNPACFSVGTCLARGAPMQMQNITMAADGSCSFALTSSMSGNNWNCALETTDGTGECMGPNGGPPCLVPLESDPGEGFTITPGVQVTMVAGVCKKIMNGATLYIDKSSCATKVEAAPVCQPTGVKNPTPDAGLTADATAPARDSSAGDATAQDATATPDTGTGHDATAGDSSACLQVGQSCFSPGQCCSGACAAGTCAPGAVDSGGPPPGDAMAGGG